MAIFIGADFVPTNKNVDFFSSGEINRVIGPKLLDRLKEMDFRIFNLEAPLLDYNNPIQKCGPNLRTPSSASKGYIAVNANLLTLANNHIMDQGEEGLKNTISILKESDIDFVGAGESLSEASIPYIFTNKDKTIGVLAVTENEFSSADEMKAGACPYDPLETFDNIKALKQKCDFVIILYHGGKEHYQYPSPNLQRVFHKMINSGADLVIAQHTHCVGCKEEYNNGVLVYGQGNFCFGSSEIETWNYSIGIIIEDDYSINYLPLKVTNNGDQVEVADISEGEKILKAFHKRSAEILSPGFIDKAYEEFACESINNYLKTLSGKESFLFKVINRILHNKLRLMKIRHRYDEKQLLAIENFIKCEAHRELLIRGLISKTE